MMSPIMYGEIINTGSLTSSAVNATQVAAVCVALTSAVQEKVVRFYPTYCVYGSWMDWQNPALAGFVFSISIFFVSKLTCCLRSRNASDKRSP